MAVIGLPNASRNCDALLKAELSEVEAISKSA